MDRNPDSPWNPAKPVEISPTEFEKQVLVWLQRMSASDQTSSMNAVHQGVVNGASGAYAIDVLVELFLLGGAKVLILVECKHQRRPVERDEVIILDGKLRDVGAHKGMLFSTSGFQLGAVNYAKTRGIATVTVIDGRWLFETRTIESSSAPPPWIRFGRFAGLRLCPTGKGMTVQTIDSDHTEPLSKWLAAVKSEHTT
jgi:restriction system protein